MIKWLVGTDVTVMTLTAVIGIDAEMIKHIDSKRICGMAINTVLIIWIGGNMIKKLTNTDGIVMTTRTIVANSGMIVSAGGEGSGGVA